MCYDTSNENEIGSKMKNPYQIICDSNNQQIALLRSFIDSQIQYLQQNRSPESDGIALKMLQDYNKVNKEILKLNEELIIDLPKWD